MINTLQQIYLTEVNHMDKWWDVSQIVSKANILIDTQPDSDSIEHHAVISPNNIIHPAYVTLCRKLAETETQGTTVPMEFVWDFLLAYIIQARNEAGVFPSREELYWGAFFITNLASTKKFPKLENRKEFGTRWENEVDQWTDEDWENEPEIPKDVDLDDRD